MRRTLLVLFLLASHGALAQDPGEKPCAAVRASGSPRDLEAIAELHRRDMEASRAKDYETLISLWTEDIVSLPPGQPITRGKAESRAALEQIAQVMGGVEILDYVLAFEELVVLGEWAFEWGTYRGRFRTAPQLEPAEQEGKLLRILARQADGSWKIARTIYN